MEESVCAYLLTFTTFGTWLHGRETGSVDRYHNQLHSPILPADPHRRESARARMREGEYILDEPRRHCVLEAIREQAKHRGWCIWAAHVRTTHVHVVISATNIRPEKIMMHLKAWSSRRLREKFDEGAAQTRWTRHGSTRYLWNEEARNSAIQYVIERQGDLMSVFPDPIE